MTPVTDLSSLFNTTGEFTARHVGPTGRQQQAMLTQLGVASLDELIKQSMPEAILEQGLLALPEGLPEADALALLKRIAGQNKVNRSYIGMGYYNTHVPGVILRNVLENPAWYTAYTPYQPEISQGRLEALLNFQQMVMDLTGMELANASMLDEATAAAEAMTLCKRSNRKNSDVFFVAGDVHPQTIDVIKTRAEYLGLQVVVGNPATELAQHDVFAVQLQYPGTYGDICDLQTLIDSAHSQDALACVATDLMALMLLKSPGELGADVVLGSAQRFGLPMGFGGPHAAFFAARDKFKRSVPGRIIGVSVDARGNRALRMAMQTREQHIRREKATSNICTAQALLANMAGFYAVYHGPEGLRTIAERIHCLTSALAVGLRQKGVAVNDSYFDTLALVVGEQQDSIYRRALGKGCNLRLVATDRLGISLDETTTAGDVADLLDIVLGDGHGLRVDDLLAGEVGTGISPGQRRRDAVLSHPVFNSYQAETDMLRYLKRLENRDYSLAHGMIPLGSCTMKLNAAAEMMPVTWPEFADIHPFAPVEQAEGYRQMIDELNAALMEITGYDAVSMQPNAGSQGEYAGLLAIRKYHQSLGQEQRDVCLIPSSAHGTNPASASMMGMRVVIVECDDSGNIDLTDLTDKAEKHAGQLGALMITYPSTHGVFEEQVREVCDIIHRHGGQVYLDGANMNAMVGIAKPGAIGADVSHLNLHKTFAIPHGGGGPGMGPIGVKRHLEAFLPGHAVVATKHAGNGAVSAAPYGSGAILPITWMYIRMLGRQGLKQATAVAILNANYIAERLSGHYPVLYRGRNNRVAHECIIDMRPLKDQSGVTEEDVAKRLMDYGFHAPTMSFPVAGTLMIEPTESESQQELDRFIDAMLGIREEIRNVQEGRWDALDNPLKNAPHTQVDLAAEDWNRSYSRMAAAYPSGSMADKFWPAVNRVDNVFGDRNFVCSCPPMESYREG